jgi:hypothetical protein
MRDGHLVVSKDITESPTPPIVESPLPTNDELHKLMLDAILLFDSQFGAGSHAIFGPLATTIRRTRE